MGARLTPFCSLPVAINASCGFGLSRHRGGCRFLCLGCTIVASIPLNPGQPRPKRSGTGRSFTMPTSRCHDPLLPPLADLGPPGCLYGRSLSEVEASSTSVESGNYRLAIQPCHSFWGTRGKLPVDDTAREPCSGYGRRRISRHWFVQGGGYRGSAD